MKILVIGTPQQTEELQAMLPADAEATIAHDINQVEYAIPNFKLIFDLSFDQSENRLLFYTKAKDTLVIAGAVKRTLAESVFQFGQAPVVSLIGMNTLPTLINRPALECSVLKEKDKEKGHEVGRLLGRTVHWVADRVGMVTPRILLMLINEACYTHQEGTASRSDIDLGMQLGTAYPRGPLAWADAIGIELVHNCLEAVYQDTRDERYRISPLLRHHFLTGTPLSS